MSAAGPGPPGPTPRTLREAHTAAEFLALRCAGLVTGLAVVLRDLAPEQAEPIEEQVEIMRQLATDLAETLRRGADPAEADR
jgi:hypothetical protein